MLRKARKISVLSYESILSLQVMLWYGIQHGIEKEKCNKSFFKSNAALVFVFAILQVLFQTYDISVTKRNEVKIRIDYYLFGT